MAKKIGLGGRQKEVGEKQKRIHARYIFSKSRKITPGWISAVLWAHGTSVSRDTIIRNAKKLFKMMEKENV